MSLQSFCRQLFTYFKPMSFTYPALYRDGTELSRKYIRSFYSQCCDVNTTLLSQTVSLITYLQRRLCDVDDGISYNQYDGCFDVRARKWGWLHVEGHFNTSFCIIDINTITLIRLFLPQKLQ
jgi:hypothetical protein